ncbi:MAG TPA: hypothetical protein VMW56_25230 [Candidatus Margulisiibacteriota bacterium]|nr:hypothetical protein [Candidatus Margulisiibacteriota bacterium]
MVTTLEAPVCAEHKCAREWRTAVFEYDEDGVSIRIPNVEAWVCPAGGDPTFLPETADELIAVGRELLAAARKARQRRSALTEYIVSVGSR